MVGIESVISGWYVLVDEIGSRHQLSRETWRDASEFRVLGEVESGLKIWNGGTFN